MTNYSSIPPHPPKKKTATCWRSIADQWLSLSNFQNKLIFIISKVFSHLMETTAACSWWLRPQLNIIFNHLKTMFQVYEKKKSVRWRYDVGRKNNFEQVRPTWMCPLESLLSLFCMDTKKLGKITCDR